MGDFVLKEKVKRLVQTNEVNNMKGEVTVETKYTHQAESSDESMVLAHQEVDSKLAPVEAAMEDAGKQEVSLKD